MVWLVSFTQIKIHTYIKMVKNIPTIERSTKIRFGKHATDDQAENTIVFNASDTAINASTAGSMYMSPLREAELSGATFIGYSSTTKEVVDTGVATSLLGGVTLDSAGVQGNVVSNSIPHFANITTAFTTGHLSNVGISNTAPTHMLSVGDKIFMSNTGAEAIKVEGNVRANRFFGGTAVTISGSATNKIQVSGKIKTSTLESSDSIAISNNQTVTKLVSVGTHTFIHNPSATESAITTSGNVTAAFYKGDAGLLSNVIHTGTLPISKGGTGQTSASAAASALGVGTEDQPSFVTVSANVNASNIVSGDGRGINQLNASNVSIGTLAIARGGTGADTASAAASALGVGAEDSPQFTGIELGHASDTTLARSSAGVVTIEGAEIRTGTVAIGKGGTGETTAAAAASALGVGAEDQPSFVTVNANVNAGNVVTTTIELGHASDTTLARSSAGVVTIEGAEIRTGTVAIGKGGTGQTTAAAAASALGVGTEDQPSFITVNANVIAHNVASTSLTTGILPYVHSTKQLRDSKLSYNDATYVTSLASNLVVTGNLHVQGSTTFQHSNIHSVSDPIIEIGNANAIDTIDMGIIMTRPTANVAAGFRGDEKEYTIAFTLSDPDGAHIVPTMATSDGYITANVWGNVLSGNVTSTGLIHGGTLKGDGSAITALNMGNASSGTLVVGRGGTGADTAAGAATNLGLGTGNSPQFTGIELGHASDTTLARSSAGVVTIEGAEIRTGTVPIGKGGTGQTTASAAASALGVGTEDSPQFTGIELGHASDTTLARSSAGVVTIEGAEIRTGTVPIGKGGTGQTTASAAASALGVGAEDQPSFVTVNANVVAGNVTSESIKLTDPGITGSFSTDTITINAENRTYGTAPLVVATGDIDKLNLDNLIDGAQVVVSILASGGDRAVSKDLTNVNFTVLTEDVTIDQDKHGLMTLSNIAGNVYMNTIAFS